MARWYGRNQQSPQTRYGKRGGEPYMPPGVRITRAIGSNLLDGLRRSGALGEPKPVITPIRLTDLQIRTKTADLVPFIPNEIQRMYLGDLKDSYPTFSWEDGLLGLDGARETILKARQAGMSTLIEAMAYAIASSRPNYVAWIVADNLDRAEGLFAMIRRFLRHDPREPHTSSDSAKEIRFSEIDSLIKIGTAGDPKLGRSATINFLHCSEVAFWPDWSVRGGLLQSVPPSGIVFQETTASGHNDFYNHWEACQRKEVAFLPRFFGWQMSSEYRSPCATPTDAETAIMRRYSVDGDQARWYVTKERELREADTAMTQEYPAHPDEAFVSTGQHTIFPQEYLQSELVRLKGSYSVASAFETGQNGLQGNLHVYEAPEPGCRYFMPADIAEGSVDEKGDSDFSCFSVYRVDNWTQVASYWGKPDPLSFGDDMAALAAWYNGAECCPEANKEFYAVYGRLIDSGLNVTTMTLRGGEEKAGFLTSERTKRDGDATLTSLILDSEKGYPSLVIRDFRVIAELLQYGVLKNSRRGALRGHDDRVTETRIAAWFLTERCALYKKAPQKRTPKSLL